MREARPDTAPKRFLVPVLKGRQRVKYVVAILIWAALAAYFWTWWLQPSNVIEPGRYILVTTLIFWVFFLQIYFLMLFLNARKSNSTIEDLGAFRAAMVVTKTPSEPFAVVRRTLEAMLAQTIPHDTWLADEDPAPETVAWCREHGVRISTRKGRADYHRTEWPRRTRCKEGNLAFFYDHYGYENYDFVSQLDADHVPEPTYLEEMLKPFADPSVGYVSAPSMCCSNAGDSWAARTRLHSEAMFHGVLQAGYSGGWAPMCIGSHYAVRTKALRAVGGLGPELAEDHSTSMILNANGWRGVHAIDALAYGDGPGSVADLVTQEFQWSRSLLTLLLRYTPRYFRGLRPRLKFQFVFSQLWYPLFAVFMLMMYALPGVALIFDIRYADVTYPAFLAHVLPATLFLVVIAFMIRRDRLFRPIDAKILGWEKAYFASAQWFWVLLGCAMAIWDRITGKFVDFRVTPKGEAVTNRMPVRVIAPYAVLAAGALLPILLVSDVEDAKGFYILSWINAVLYISLFFVIVMRHRKERAIPIRHLGASGALQFTSAAVLAMLAGTAIWLRGTESVAALTAGLEPLHVTETKFVASGAGSGPPGSLKYLFNFGWK